MGRLDGKVAIISGGARGQGAAEARIFAREGAKVVIGDILDEAGKQVEAEIRGSGGEATFVHLDVTRDADWRDAVQTARSLSEKQCSKRYTSLVECKDANYSMTKSRLL